jgi:putative transposase
MKVQRAYRTELRLNGEQRRRCLRSAGTARFAYNWGLRRKIDAYRETGRSPDAMRLHRLLNEQKKTEFPWMYEVSKCCPQEALRDLDRAFVNFFRRVKKGGKPGFPRFKSRKRGIGGFRLTGSIRVEENAIHLPRLGRLRLKERGYLPAGKHVLSATVSERAGRWFVSALVEEEIDPPAHYGGAVGIDVGLEKLAVLSDGSVCENPRALEGALVKLRRLGKSVSRKRKGSNHRRKAILRLSRQHYRIACIRRDAIHKATTAITKQFGLIGIESLNVRGMIRGRHLSRSVSDAGLSELQRQIKYKALWRGGRVIEADRFFPSSKTCSRCKTIKKNLSLGERIFRCEACGLVLDRDLNAAINLRDTAVSSTVEACGDATGGGIPVARESTSRASTKHEAEKDEYSRHGIFVYTL